MKTYAGIGSRETPKDTLQLMYCLGGFLAKKGYELHSGGAPGADEKFEAGCADTTGSMKIFLPWDGFQHRYWARNPDHRYYHPLEMSEYREEAIRIAHQFHPNFDALTVPASKLMARNSFQVLGEDLESPVDFVACWTPGAKGGGGTGQAIRIAKAFAIPIFDLADPLALAQLEEFIGGKDLT